MNTVYSTFDALVEEAAQPDDALWKVETVRYFLRCDVSRFCRQRVRAFVGWRRLHRPWWSLTGTRAACPSFPL